VDQQRKYHRIATMLLAAATLIVVSLTVMLVPIFSSSLDEYSLLGFPVGFYLVAQGAIIFFIAAIFWCAGRQEWIDRKFGAAEDS